MMNVIGKSALVKYRERQPSGLPKKAAQTAMMEWYTMASDASWDHFDELKKTFNSADYVTAAKSYSMLAETNAELSDWLPIERNVSSSCSSAHTQNTTILM